MLQLWARVGALSALALLVMSMPLPFASAQSPFEACLDTTSGNATIIFPETATLSVDGDTLRPGDELAVFDTDERCVGKLTWSGTGSQALIVWEAGLFQESEAGLQPGDPITLHVWKRDDARLFEPANSTIRITLDTSAPYLRDTLRYQRDGMYVVEQLTIRPGS